MYFLARRREIQPLDLFLQRCKFSRQNLRLQCNDIPYVIWRQSTIQGSFQFLDKLKSLVTKHGASISLGEEEV